MCPMAAGKRSIQRRSWRGPSLAKRNPTVAASRLASATDVMPAGNHLLIPTLDRVPLEYHLSGGDASSIRLARTLVELELAAPKDWETAKRDPAAYVLLTLERWIAAHGGDAIKRRFDLYVMLTDYLDEYSSEHEPDGAGRQLYLIVNPDSAAFVVLGQTLELLEKADPRLPATFYCLFAAALNRWVRLYDFHDAEERVAMLREWLEGEPDADEYEMPDVEGSIPGCMKQRPFGRRKLKALSRRIRGQQAKALLKGALELAAISERAKRSELTDEMREILCDSNPPLPTLLAVFAESDGIEACFDEEQQTALECLPESNVIIPFNAHESMSVQQAFHSLGVLCHTLATASRLIDFMPGNEKWVREQ